MKKAIIIVLLIAQANSMSFYDVFAPVEDSLGRLVTDVVSDIKETIDCTLMAVERVFTLDGLFGGPSDYDQRCKGQNTQNADNYEQNADTASYVEAPDSPTVTTEKEIIKDVVDSVSDAKTSIQNILDQSDAQSKIENVQNTIKNETERLNQINALLRHELEKLPDKVRKKFSLDLHYPTKLEDIFEEIKTLYELEQKDKSSADANEVRRVFDKVLVILRCTGLDSSLSDQDEVKLILKLLGKSSNDVEKQVTVWTDEENKNIKNIMIITNATEALSDTKGNEDKAQENRLLTEKMDEMETQQARMVDLSHSLKDLTKNILDEVGSIGSPKPSNDHHNVSGSLGSSDESSTSMEIKFVSTNSPPQIINSTESSTIPEINSVSTETSVTTQSSQEQVPLIPTTVETASVIETESKNSKTTDPSEFSEEKDSPAATTSTTMKLSIATEIKPVPIDSKTKANSISEKLYTVVNENAYTPAVQLPSTTTITEPTDPEKAATTQLPLATMQPTNMSKQLQSDSQTYATSTQVSPSSNTIETISTAQSPQTSSKSIETIQSNMQTVITEAQLPASNAQQQEADSQINTATPHTPGVDSQDYSSTPPPNEMANQPDTATDLPKTFKELAQKLFGNIDPSEIKDYDYSPEDSAAIRTEEMAQLEELEKLFGPQDRASQQAAVDGAKNVIEGSKLTSTLMKKLFQNQDQASAPSVFDNYEY